MAATARVIPFPRTPRPDSGAESYSYLRHWAAQCARPQRSAGDSLAEQLAELIERVADLERKISA